MGQIHATDCDDLPYGPGQSDYEYDLHRQRKDDMEPTREPMSPLGQLLFDQMTLVNESQRIALMMGRQQMARDVVGWIHANAHLLGGVPIETLLALCNKELKRP